MASLIHATAHGLSAGDGFRFANILPTNSGVDEGTTYYVLAASLGADQFEFSTTDGGTAFVLTNAILSGDIVAADSYVATTDGGMSSPTAVATPTGLAFTSTNALDADGHAITRLDVSVTQPTSATHRATIVTVTPDAGNPVQVTIPVGQTTATVPHALAGTGYSATAVAQDVFGNLSAATSPVTHTAAVDATAPAWAAPNATSGGLVATGAILGAILTWVSVPDLDLDHYDVAISSDGGSTYPTVYSAKTTAITVTQLAAGTYWFKVRAVDKTGNASAYVTAVSAAARTVVAADITAGTITATQIAANTIDASRLLIGSPGIAPLDNPGFETGDTSGWQGVVTGTGAVTASTSHPRSGQYGVALAPGSSGTSQLLSNQYFPATNGDVFALSLWAYGSSSPNVSVGIAQYDSSKGFLATVSSTTGVLAASQTHVTKVLTVSNASTAFVRINITLATANATAYLDDISLNRGGVVIDADGITIYNGQLTFEDQYGNTALQGSGFGGTWLDFISDGLYNSNLQFATAGTISDGEAVALQNWTVSRGAGTTLPTITATANTSWPGGKYLDIAPGSTGGYGAFLSDLVPITPLYPLLGAIVAAYTAGTAGATANFEYRAIWYKADGTTSAGSDFVTNPFQPLSGTVSTVQRYYTGYITPPAAARFVKVRITPADTGTYNAGNHLKWGGASLTTIREVGGGAAIWPNGTSPWLPWATTTALAHGQAYAYPVNVSAPTWLLGLSCVNADTTLTRSLEWAVYYDNNANVLTRVEGTYGTMSFTAAAKAVHTSFLGQGIFLLPGSYFIVVRNTQSTNAFTFTAEASHLGITMNYGALYFGTTAALASSLDISGFTGGATVGAVWLMASGAQGFG